MSVSLPTLAKIDRRQLKRPEPVPEYDRLVASYTKKAEAIVSLIESRAMGIFRREYSPDPQSNSDLDVNAQLLALQAEAEEVVSVLESVLRRVATEVDKRDLVAINRHLKRAGLAPRLDSRARMDVQALENLLVNASPKETEKLFNAFVDNNVQKISSVSTGAIDEMRTLVSSGFRSGMPTNKLAKQIQKRFGVAKSRAKLIARDQVGKLQGELNRARQKEVGVVEYIWRTSKDERVRESHMLEGQKFSWNAPPSVGHPGEDFQCRCYAEPVLTTATDVEPEPEAATIPLVPEAVVPEALPGPALLSSQEYKRQYFGWADAIKASPASEAALIAWQGTDYRIMRTIDSGNMAGASKRVFGDKRLLSEAAERTRLVKEAVDTAPKFQGVTFRGLGNLDEKTLATFTTTGATIEHKALHSWTMKEETAALFSQPGKNNGVVLVSNKPVGVELAKGVPFSVDEGEVLASSNKMRVVGVTKKPFSKTRPDGKVISGEVTYVEVELIE